MCARVRTTRRGRLVMWLSLLMVLAVIGWVSYLGPDYFRIQVYARRIGRGTRPQSSLIALAKTKRPSALRILEKYALKPLPSLKRSQAIKLICRYFPESNMARGVADWESISGRAYGYGWGMGAPHSQWGHNYSESAASIEALEDWLGRYSRHPGRDDVFLQLAYKSMARSPKKALEYCYRAFYEGDRDKREFAANNFQRILERDLSADEILEMLAMSAGEKVKDNLLYVAALKTMRSFEFEKALPLFEASVKARRAQPLVLQGSLPRRATTRMDLLPRRNEEARKQGKLNAIDRQIVACKWFVERANRIAESPDDESRAATLHEMARNCFEESELFLNHLYYEYPKGNDAPNSEQLGLEDIHDANHYRQAAMLLRRIVQEYPDYSEIEKVEYSIPLCAWRIRRAWNISIGGAIDEEIWTGFQAFAEKYPDSSMADDALYIAGIHHRLQHGPKNNTKIRENMQRIARDHRDGDVVSRYGTSNGFLEKALESDQRGK